MKKGNGHAAYNYNIWSSAWYIPDDFGSAALRSFGESRRPMYYLLLSGIVNVILNLFLVICFRLRVAGVAIATVISNILSAALVISDLHMRRDEFQFQLHKMTIKGHALKKVLVIGIPAGIQGAIFIVYYRHMKRINAWT